MASRASSVAAKRPLGTPACFCFGVGVPVQLNFALQLPRGCRVRHWDEFLVAFWELLPLAPYAPGDEPLTVRVLPSMALDDALLESDDELEVDLQLDELEDLFVEKNWNMLEIVTNRLVL